MWVAGSGASLVSSSLLESLEQGLVDSWPARINLQCLGSVKQSPLGSLKRLSIHQKRSTMEVPQRYPKKSLKTAQKSDPKLVNNVDFALEGLHTS